MGDVDAHLTHSLDEGAEAVEGSIDLPCKAIDIVAPLPDANACQQLAAPHARHDLGDLVDAAPGAECDDDTDSRYQNQDDCPGPGDAIEGEPGDRRDFAE